MTWLNPIMFFFGEGFVNNPILVILLAGLASYLGWVSVEYIPFTRRILERRQNPNPNPAEEGAEG